MQGGQSPPPSLVDEQLSTQPANLSSGGCRGGRARFVVPGSYILETVFFEGAFYFLTFANILSVHGTWPNLLRIHSFCEGEP